MKFSGLFSDHAVLQRHQPIPVWGWATPGAIVDCQLGEERASARCADDGAFLLRFAPRPQGGPFDLTGCERGSQDQCVVHDLMIGQVWLAAGQSNMALSMDDIGESGNVPQLRMFTVPKRADVGGHRDLPGTWMIGGHGSFSAVAFYFAQELAAREPSLTIGVINASVGATRIEAWLSREDLMQLPLSRTQLLDYEAKAFLPQTWEHPEWKPTWLDSLEKLYDVMDLPVYGLQCQWHSPDFDDAGWKQCQLPNTFSQLGFNRNGALWFRKRLNLPSGTWHLTATPTTGNLRIFVNGIENGDLKEGENLIAIRVYCYFGDGGFKDGPLTLTRGQETISLKGTWSMNVETDLTKVVRIPEDTDDRSMLRRFLPYVTFHTPNGTVRTKFQVYGEHLMNTPAILHENMIRPLMPYALSGILWYQGESNCDGNGDPYEDKLRQLIRTWKHAWGQERLPIYIVQLTAFGTPEECNPNSTWATLREAQAKANQTDGDGLAVIVDAGDQHTIHPLDKKTVGKRLAAITQDDETAMAPTLKACHTENRQLILIFDHAEGLHGTDGFFLADAQGNIRPAIVTVNGNKVSLDNPDMPNPRIIYYQWADNPRCTGLKNKFGIPALPFRLIR